MNKDNGGNSIDLILVGKCPLSLSDYKTEANNTVNES